MKRLFLFLMLISVLTYTGCGGGSGGATLPPTTTGAISGTISAPGGLSINKYSASNFPTFALRNNHNNHKSASITNEKIVKFNPSLSREEVDRIISNIGAKIKYKLHGFDNTFLITVTSPSFSAMSINPNIIYMENNNIYHTFVTPSDSYYYSQWNLPMMFLPEAWDLKTGDGSSIVVAVIDTGISTDHPDLQDNLVPGWDYIDNYPTGDNDPSDTGYNPVEPFSHGTHVAGIISARTNNGLGVAGVGWNVKIMPIRVLGLDGSGTSAGIADGIMWAANNTDNPVQVINLSLGSSDTDQTVKNAIDYAISKGIIVVAAAGNENGPVSFPASYDPVIAVAALGPDGTRAPYSNFGPEIDVCAPGGTNIVTDWDTQTILSTSYIKDPTDIHHGNWYVYMVGTSMAAPHVSGLIALLLAHGVAAGDVETRLNTFVIDKGSYGKDNYYGYGMPDSYAALNNGFTSIKETQVLIVDQNKSIIAINYPNSSNNYQVNNVPPGNYYVCAFFDKNMDGIVDIDDKFGYISNVLVKVGEITGNINIELNVPAQNSTLTTYLENVLN